MMITSSSVQRVVQNHDGHHNTARHFLTQPQKNFSVLKGSWPAHKSTFTCKSGVKKNSCHYKDLLQILCNLSKKWKNNILTQKFQSYNIWITFSFLFSFFEAIQIWSKYSKWPLILLSFQKWFKQFHMFWKCCKWFKKVENDQNWIEIMQKGSKWFK